MAKTVNINVSPKRASIARLIVLQTLFWSLIVGAEAVSRITFGGAWPLDVLVLMAGALGLLGSGALLNGVSVNMTPEEVDAWINAGMPDDAKGWRAIYRNRKEVAPRTVTGETVMRPQEAALRQQQEAILRAAKLR